MKFQHFYITVRFRAQIVEKAIRTLFFHPADGYTAKHPNIFMPERPKIELIYSIMAYIAVICSFNRTNRQSYHPNNGE